MPERIHHSVGSRTEGTVRRYGNVPFAAITANGIRTTSATDDGDCVCYFKILNLNVILYVVQLFLFTQ